MTLKIKRPTRLNIFQILKREQIKFQGMLNDVDFLSRIYDLDDMPSHDYRYKTASMDITQHRVWATDWDDYWIIEDKRFDLMNCNDEKLLKFLCETIHPIVRPDEKERKDLLKLYNYELLDGGYQIEEIESQFGKKYYKPTGITPMTINALEDIPDIDSELNSENIRKYVTRITTNLEDDPELAIGTSKEFIEGVLKTFLRLRKIDFSNYNDIPNLTKLVFTEIQEASNEKDEQKIQEYTKKISRTMTTLIQTIAEIRNYYGSGHGKEAGRYELGVIHASLVANMATTIVLFVIQSYEKYFKFK